MTKLFSKKAVLTAVLLAAVCAAVMLLFLSPEKSSPQVTDSAAAPAASALPSPELSEADEAPGQTAALPAVSAEDNSSVASSGAAVSTPVPTLPAVTVPPAEDDGHSAAPQSTPAPSNSPSETDDVIGSAMF